MVRIDMFLFGYRRVTVAKEDVGKVANILLRLSVCTAVSSDGIFLLRERDYKRFCLACEGKVEYSASATLGVLGFFKKNSFRYGTASALIAVIILNILLSGLVWDVRISGNETITDYEILEALDAGGFSVGARWSRIDKNKIENALLNDYDKISWLAINRRGTVAYVEVVEKEGESPAPAPTGYSNVVAACDSVIEEITVKRGVAAVSPGDVVRKGDILISGVLPEQSGGGFCYAEGTVTGSLEDRVSVDVAKEEEIVSERREKLCGFSVEIFGFLINIFQMYGNSPFGCDIIKDVEDCILFERFRLPVSVVRSYSVQKQTETVSYSNDRMCMIAKERMKAKIAATLGEGDLLKMRTDGRFTDTGYSMESVIIYSAEIGENQPFEVVE